MELVPMVLDQEKNRSPCFRAQKNSTYWSAMSLMRMVRSPQGAMPIFMNSHSSTPAGMPKDSRYTIPRRKLFCFVTVFSFLTQDVDGPFFDL